MKLESELESFKNGSCTREKLNQTILEFAYIMVKNHRYIEAGDFILEFMPHVNTIIDEYNETLCCFTTYINKHIQWNLLSIQKKYIKKKALDNAFMYHYKTEYENHLYTSENTPAYMPQESNIHKLVNYCQKLDSSSFKKRLEIFTLKNARWLKPEHLEDLAPLTGKSIDELRQNIAKLEVGCEKSIKNREYLQLRFNRLFMSLTMDQNKLRYLNSGEEKQILQHQINLKYRRKNDIYEKLKKRKCAPKNSEIAQILNIPKGTVDSSLFYIRKQLESLHLDLYID